MTKAVPAWEDPRRTMKRHGLAPKRRFSQNFLVSRHAVDSIVRAVAPSPGQRCVELGPGLGTLTAALLREGAEVVAIDQDRDMLRVLETELGHVEALTVVEGDAASVDLSQLAPDGPISVVGNLPYAITGAILRNLTTHRAHVSHAVIMVQREVGLRLAATPGNKTYGAATVFAQAAFEIETVLKVSRGSFHPPPKIDSVVLRLRTDGAPRAEETDAFRAIVKAAFGRRRKTLRNALSSLEGAEQALGDAGIDSKRRAETLSVEELAELARVWEEIAP
ncbi:MAG: 16S rRNA (adenine(1518)-N(6)/adenine(1519)-N(6))-dimethyltransferase RsmA [Sandaracinaceae bacterium]